MSQGAHQIGDKKPGDSRSEDPSHPGMSADPAERGKQLGHENAQGGQSVGTGGHGTSGGGSNQPVGGHHVQDPSKFSEEQLHPGMNPDPAQRGQELGHANAQGGQSVGTGGHGPNAPNMGK